MTEPTISYWHQTEQPLTYPSLIESITTETLIIGGGITGVSAAYCLAEKGAQVTLIEADSLCSGTTGNTTGKTTIQHGLLYHSIKSKHGKDFARLYAKSQTDALYFIKDTVEKLSIPCGFTMNTSYVYARTEKEFEAMETEHETVSSLGIDGLLIRHPGFPKDNRGMLGFQNQGVFHPIRYVNGLAVASVANGASIYCGTKAVKIEHDGDSVTVLCNTGVSVKAKHLIIATGYPVYDGMKFFFTRLYPRRDYGIAVIPEKEWPEGSYVAESDPVRSVRTHMENGQRILIVVGETHVTGRGDENTEAHFDELIKFARELAGVKQVIAKWSAQDYMTPDKIPYIGRISDQSDLFVASGFNKWGMTGGTLAGMMLSDLIVTGKNPYEELYSLSRSDILSSPGTVLKEVGGFTLELIKSKLEKTDGIRNLTKGEGKVILFGGDKAGIYRDENDNITVLDIACTHLSTELNFNRAERSWDCPAHGGRFSAMDGTRLEGPPKQPLKIYLQCKYSDLFE
ncbi:MAG: hypothetical protein BGN88_00320 [Clostridiales bacterium 43-6]|nr:MAG: hypothetical protein BGN88_00320 [Clostridiales bacterium 43-6]